MDCIVHGVAKGQTQLSDFHFLDHSTQPRPVRPLKAAPAPRVSPSLPGWHCPALRTPLLPTAKPDPGRAWVIFLVMSSGDFDTHNVNHVKFCGSVLSRTFTAPCDHHLFLVPNGSRHPRANPSSLNSHSPAASPRSLPVTNPLSSSGGLPALDISSKGNHTARGFLHLASSTRRVVFSCVACLRTPLLLVAE